MTRRRVNPTVATTVGVLVPIQLLFIILGLLDTHIGLILVYALINLPMVV